MSNHPDHQYPIMGQYDPYAAYENHYRQPFPRPPGGQAHLDDIAFWYRPEVQEPAFEHNTILYNQRLSMAHSPLESANIKHRRTRSGCFTCRQRRVKCDETRPICERCKKGNRECQFPQPSSSSRRVDTNDSRGSHGKLPGQESKTGPSRQLHNIEDESEDDREESTSPFAGPFHSEQATSSTQVSRMTDSHRKLQRKPATAEMREDQESPHSAESGSQHSRNPTPVSICNTPPPEHRRPARSWRWKHLNTEMQQYLQFHHNHISRYHYLLKLDSNDFIHDEFIDIALSFEPLLHAVVGFSAYHHALSKPNGRFQDFWRYYCQSIMLLRKWLETHTERNEAALLTILQLATFEEYLGDWASVASHQKAAYSIFITLYTHDNVMATETSRCIFDWLARADVAVGLMAGATTVLERHWFVTARDWHNTQTDEDGLDADTALPCFVAKLRLIGFDMAAVFANAGSNRNTMQHIHGISKRMDVLRLEIQALHDVTYSSRRTPRGDKGNGNGEDAFDTRIPLFRGDLWPLNFVWVDWYSTEQMLRYQTMLFTRAMQVRAQPRSSAGQAPTLNESQVLQSASPELEKLSLIQCQIFEAIERSANAPCGAILSCQASLALSSVFLKKTPKYTMWARHKLATIERMGYVWPPSFRRQMAQFWKDNDVLEWWLPNDEHNSLLDEIREVVEERNREIEFRGGDERDNVREIKAVFERLDFGRNVGRTRKDSVWSATGLDPGKSTRVSSPDTSDDDEEEDSESEEEEFAQPKKRENRDSGIDTTSGATTKRNHQTPLEYSNRMSGIWEGPNYQ